MVTLRAARELLGKVLNDREPDAEKNTPETEWRRTRNIFNRLNLISTALIATLDEVDKSRDSSEQVEELWKQTQETVRALDPEGNDLRPGSPAIPGAPGIPGGGSAVKMRTLQMLLELGSRGYARSDDNSGTIELLRTGLHSIADDLSQFQLDALRKFIALDAEIAALGGDWIEKSTLTAKGDVISASAASTPVALNVGTNGQGLVADDGETTGLIWANAREAARFTSTSLFDVRDLGTVCSGGITTVTVPVNTLVAYPFWVPDRRSFDTIDFEVTTVGGAGAKARVGIYENNSETLPRPAALVYGGAEFAVDSGTNKSETPSTAVILNRGWYWRAYVCGTSAPAVRCLQPLAIAPLMGIVSTMGANAACGVQRSFTYAALPDPFGTTGLALRTANMPAVGLRWNS